MMLLLENEITLRILKCKVKKQKAKEKIQELIDLLSIKPTLLYQNINFVNDDVQADENDIVNDYIQEKEHEVCECIANDVAENKKLKRYFKSLI